MQFCGRAEEMEQITDRWRRASDVGNPDPQLVILKAERGVGKTRLALEFYRYLSETIDRVGHEGYWPDAVEILDRSIDVNPDPDACRFNVPIPYLWWGLRAADKGAENGIAGDAIATYDKFLAPHLVALTMRARMIRSGKAILDVWRDVAVGEVANWSGYDRVVSVGEGLLKTISILRGTLGSAEGTARDEHGKRSMGRVDAVMEDLESIFNPRSFTYAKTPAVILIDDAQFSADDPGLAVFAERLLHSAMTQSWPVLILVTHWKRDLSSEFLKVERSFAGILHHGRNRTPTDNGPAAGLPGGFLNAKNTLEIDLPVVPDLSGALREAFPGLLPEQGAALLDHSGGNPRHLEQIIAFLRENEDFFEDFDTDAALTDEGLTEALTETHDIFKVVMRRLRDAPQDVQEAICLASLHGVRFVSETVNELARVHLGEARDDALVKAGNPYSMVSQRRREKIAEFSERLFYMVAERRRRSLKVLADESALRTSLKAALRARLENLDVDTEIEEQVLTYGLAAQTFAEEQPEERGHLLTALAYLAAAERRRYSHEAALDAASRFIAAFRQQPDLSELPPAHVLSVCGDVLVEAGRTDDAMIILQPLLERHRGLADSLNTPDSLRDLSVSLNHVGQAAQVAGNHAEANAAYRESLDVRRNLTDRLKTTENLRDLLVSLNNVGRAAQLEGDNAAASMAYGEMLAVSRELAEQLKTPESLRDLSVALNNVGQAATADGNYAAAIETHQESLKLRRDLADRLKTPESLQDLSISLHYVGRAAQVAGDHAAAALAYSEMLDLARDLADRLKTPESLRHLNVSLLNVGRTARITGEYDAAAAAYGKSLLVARDLAERLQTPESLRDLALSLENVGRVALDTGDNVAAKEAHAESLAIRRDLANRLGTPESLRDLSVSLDHIGRLKLVVGDHEAAAEVFRESLAVVRDLAQRLKTPESLRDLSLSLHNVGRAAQAAKDLASASAAYDEMLELCRRLAKRLRTPDSLRDLSISLNNVGWTSEFVGDHAAAAAAYRESVQVARDLAKQLKTPESLRDLSVSLNNVGRTAELAGDHPRAVEAFGKGLELSRDLTKRLKTPESLRDLSVSLGNVGRAALVAGDHARAAEACEESLEVRRDLAERLKTPESLRDLCVILRLRCLLALAMSDKTRARLLLAEGELVLAELPDLFRAEEGTAFKGLEKRLKPDCSPGSA